jgi:hypothetical protein
MDRCALKQTLRERDHGSIYTKTNSETEREIMDRYALKQTVREREHGSLCTKSNGERERSWIDMH